MWNFQGWSRFHGSHCYWKLILSFWSPSLTSGQSSLSGFFSILTCSLSPLLAFFYIISHYLDAKEVWNHLSSMWVFWVVGPIQLLHMFLQEMLCRMFCFYCNILSPILSNDIFLYCDAYIFCLLLCLWNWSIVMAVFTSSLLTEGLGKKDYILSLNINAAGRCWCISVESVMNQEKPLKFIILVDYFHFHNFA